MNCVQVGIVQQFYPVTQTADIQIALKKIISINPDGTRTLAPYPVLNDVPVFILSGGSAYMSFPVAPGDTCIILFNDREIDNWYNTGNVSAPTTLRLHDKSDAMALIGIRNLTNPIGSYLTNGVEIFLNNNTWLKMTDGQITINGNLTVNGTLKTVVGATTITYNSHVHGGVQSGGSNTGGPT